MTAIGLRSFLRVPSLLSFMGICVLFFSPAFGVDQEQGKKIFEGKCYRCHGMDGLGNPKMASVLQLPIKKIDLVHGKASHMTSYEIEALVDSGNHRMPTYRGKLTDIEIHNLARYVVSLIAHQKYTEGGASK